MDLLLEKLWNFVARDTSLALPVRLFRRLCLASGIVCLLVVLPLNLFEPNLPMVVNLADIALGLFAIFCYSRSCRGKHYNGLFLSPLVLSLTPIWFFNGGIHHSPLRIHFGNTCALQQRVKPHRQRQQCREKPNRRQRPVM